MYIHIENKISANLVVHGIFICAGDRKVGCEGDEFEIPFAKCTCGDQIGNKVGIVAADMGSAILLRTVMGL